MRGRPPAQTSYVVVLSCGTVGKTESEACLEWLAITPAQPEASSTFKQYSVVSIFIEFQASDAAEVHDSGPMNAEKQVRIQILFQFCDAAPEEMRSRANVQRNIIISG